MLIVLCLLGMMTITDLWNHREQISAVWETKYRDKQGQMPLNILIILCPQSQFHL